MDKFLINTNEEIAFQAKKRHLGRAVAVSLGSNKEYMFSDAETGG